MPGCFDMTAQEVLHAGIEEEAQEDLARIAEHHDKGHQGPSGATDRKVAEMAPVDLRLLARQAVQERR
jgi:hypothetical protein